MSSLFALRALLFAGECLLGSALILALAWYAARGRASLRHLVWFTAMGALLVLPLLAAIIPSQFVITQAAPAPLPAVDTVMLAAVAGPPPATPEFTTATLATLLFAVWGAGFAWVAFRGALGFLGLRALYRRSVPYFLETDDAAKFTVAGRRWKLRLSTMPGSTGPMTWGFVRSVVLLPKCAVLWPRERLEAVLLHELAHVRRCDCIAQTLSLVACAFYWPNPLVWLGARALRREAEIAADDAVLAAGVRPSAYAGQLVNLAAEFNGHAFAGLAMAAPSALEARVQSVLAPTPSRSGATVMDILKIAGLGLVATSMLVLARPSLAQAQDTMPPAVAAPTPLEPPDTAPADAAPSEVDAPPPVPPLPPLPAVPAMPAAPAAVAAPPAPPVPPDPGVRIIRVEKDPGSVRIMRWDGPEGRLSPEQLKAMKQARIEMRKAQAEMRKAMAQVRPAIARAMAQARVSEQVAREMARLQPQIDAAVAHAMAEAKPQIDKAMAQAKAAEAAARTAAEAQRQVEIETRRVDSTDTPDEDH